MIQIQSDPIKYSLKKRDYWGIFPASRDAETGAVTPFGSPAKTCRCIKILSGSFLHHIIIISSLILQIWEQGWEWHALVEVRHEIQWSKEEKALGRWCYHYTGLSWAGNMSSLHHHDWWHHIVPTIIIPYIFQFSWGRRFFWAPVDMKEISILLLSVANLVGIVFRCQFAGFFESH